METPFPFGLPVPTAWYLSLYVGTLVLHVVFMTYVLAGSAYLVGRSLLPGSRDLPDPLVDLLREWLPFMLSAAITAGVAPLLFIQILYQRAFYTANLLLFHRWMAILPALIVGFYALYLLKNWQEKSHPGLRLLTRLVTFLCFGFVAWSWTENHLLSLQTQEVWVEQYVSQSLIYRTSQLFPRLGIWSCGSLPVLAVWLSWQLWWSHRPGTPRSVPGTRRAALMALGGLGSATLFAVWYGSTLTTSQREAVLTLAGPWLVPAALSALVLVWLWWRQYQLDELSPRRLSVLSVASVVLITGVAVAREAIRLEAVDLSQLVEHHRQATQVGGLWVFVAFLLINTLGIVWCIRMVNADDEA